MSTIAIQNLSMHFKEVKALNNITLSFQENKIYGLLGRNGAGKSTLLNLITNKLFPTSGSIAIDGEPVLENEKALSKVYCMTEKDLYPESMTVKEIFRWSKEFYPNFDTEYALKLAEKFDMNLKKRISALSTGYSSIYKIIVALACNTPIVLLDEPVLGLDANHRDLFYKELLVAYAKNPRTFIISTHLIEEVSDLIEEVVIIKNGELLIQQSAEKIITMGYGVSGKASDVEAFIIGKKVLSVDTLGGLKNAYIMGDKPNESSDKLEFSSLDLQKLFVELTNA